MEMVKFLFPSSYHLRLHNRCHRFLVQLLQSASQFSLSNLLNKQPQQQQPVRQQPVSPGVAAPQMGWQQPLPQQQHASHATANDASTTDHEHPTNHSFRHPLSRMWDWSRSELALLSNLWEHEHECASLILICHEFTCFGQTRIIQPNTRFCEDTRNVYPCI